MPKRKSKLKTEESVVDQSCETEVAEEQPEVEESTNSGIQEYTLKKELIQAGERRLPGDKVTLTEQQSATLKQAGVI